MNFHASNISIYIFKLTPYTVDVPRETVHLQFFPGRGAMDDLEKLEGKLREIGFSKTETAYYLKLFNAGECSDPERLRILGDKRKAALDEIHRLESKIISMDTMRNDIRNKK